MTDHDDLCPGPGPGTTAEAAEHELRVLLERAVPQLPAPAQRLESVRERVRRRRRRRAAGVSVTAVVAIAAAGLLLPGAGDRDGGRPQASASLAPPASGSASATSPPLPTVPPGYDLMPFDNLAGLRLVLPSDWVALSAVGSTRAYVSTQSLGLPQGGCEHQLDDFCTPLDRTLADDGVLVQFSLVSSKGLTGKLRGTADTTGVTAVSVQPVLTACRTVGGTEQLGTVILGAADSPVMVA
ncbi:hypothetical protein, partial [Actinacidiphila rubida]